MRYRPGRTCQLTLIVLTIGTALIWRRPEYAEAARQPFGIEFAVDDVALATTPEQTSTIARSLELLLRSRPEFVPDENESVIIPSGHALVDAAYRAWAKHYPLTLTPDIIWLTIVQGLAGEIEEHPEELRDQIVNHQGKMQIRIRRDDFSSDITKNPWQETVPQFAERIRAVTKNDIYSLITRPYSTSTDVSQLVVQVALMDTVSPYFEYVVDVLCGIPSIRLEGTVEDWEDLRARVQQLRRYRLDGWVEDLDPILSELVDTARGKLNLTFWRTIVRGATESEPAGCTRIVTTTISGWVVKFFPKFRQNSTVDISKFPSGMTAVDVTFDYNGMVIPLEYLGGFVGISQERESLAVKPRIGWAVRRKAGS